MNKQGTGTVVKATLVIAIITIFAKVLGFAREAVIAREYGATSIADAFLVVFNIPYMFNGILNAALVVVVVPILMQYQINNKTEEARRLFSTVFILFLSILAFVIIIGIWKSNDIINLFAPGFDLETSELASNLALIMFPSILFFALANFFAGLLNTHNIFAPSALAPVVLNTVIIGTAFTVAKTFGVYGLAWGVLLGTIVMALIQVPFLKYTDFRFRAVIDIKDEGVRKVFGLMLPIFIGSGVAQINILIYYYLGSGLAEGTISALNYATKLILLPQGIFVMAVATAIFPSLSRSVANIDREQFSNILVKGSKMVFLLSVPAVVGLIVLREPIVAVLFKRGAFDERALLLTSGVLLFLSIGLIGQCLSPVMTRGFYALQETLTPVKVSILTVAINIVISLLLVKRMEHLGLALANSVAMTVNVILLGFLLRKHITRIMGRGLISFSCKVVISSVVMGMAVYSVDNFLANILSSLSLRLLIDITLGGLVYFIMAFILKTDELYYVLDLVKGVINKRTSLRKKFAG
ncbi:murein biosynthesis integral membrane protein MurJ [Desulforamulus aquiferis]|uniref:Probable lipid II flippase MurJ n=1 Tax=Desulforamulus aquiferis TaxID=1397668 RepID=A0AAW7ZDK3_9FIRM|nr:murein biosynthesis integral membrane protein MurJ [Desulforamulus aquiferis]MDO7786870.1 murein biosynthesis integral membrane protein MurJ [Desulforamulus aquiferis]